MHAPVSSEGDGQGGRRQCRSPEKRETRTEERILELQQGKRDLAGAIVSEDNASLATLRKEDPD